jgi:hypothetical protein
MTAIRAEDKVLKLMEEMNQRLKAIKDLNLPVGPSGSLESYVKWLTDSYPQEELRTMVLRGLRVLDTFTHEDPEWDVLCDMLDPFWYALSEDNRP